MLLSILAFLVALRSCFIFLFMWSNYFSSKHKFTEFLSYLFLSSADVVIIAVCIMFIFRDLP